MAATIYLHWTATAYDWIRHGPYHSIICGDGRVHRLHSYSVNLSAHTWQRNSSAVALSLVLVWVAFLILGRNRLHQTSLKAFAHKRQQAQRAGVGAQ